VQTGEAYPVGSLVNARRRDWIVLPSPFPNLLRLKPVTGPDSESAGVFLPLERDGIRPATFTPPDLATIGPPGACRTLFDAARLLLRSSATPFRGAGRLSFEPRPYQYVPLVMALRLDPIRLLIADAVGVGKTIEAGLIAQEMMERGLAHRLLVLCPAHLCDQWQTELQQKFNLEVEVIQPSTFNRLERQRTRQDQHVYQYYPLLVASIDFVKSDKHRWLLLNGGADLVIVDEAHTATRPRGDTGAERSQQQRYRLVRELADDPKRHLILVTATPHSGIEENFRSLIGLLDKSFDLPPDKKLDRARLLPHLIQRERKDVERWMGKETPFPDVEPIERTYAMSAPYSRLFEEVRDWCRESISAAESAGGTTAGTAATRRRVRFWAALAILRSLLSSPASGEAVLSRREGKLDAPGPSEQSTDEDGATEEPGFTAQVLDGDGEQGTLDLTPSGPVDSRAAAWTELERRRLRDFCKRARTLRDGENDTKLAAVEKIAAGLLDDGFNPIIFCRFIDTAEYVADCLRERLGRYRNLEIQAVTGRLPEETRRKQVEDLGQAQRRLLVATDCLSEGVNLQEHFDAVVHYDLPWNPNRIQQRDGRVDRYGQKKRKVRTVLLYGTNNPIDLHVLEVLIRKAHTIRSKHGLSVAAPLESDSVIEALVGSIILERRGAAAQFELGFGEERVSRFHARWEEEAAREAASRNYFRHHTIDPGVIRQELEQIDNVLGDHDTVRRFVTEVTHRLGGVIQPKAADTFLLNPGGALQPRLKQRTGLEFPQLVSFSDQRVDDALRLGRAHPLVEEMAAAVVAQAFNKDGDNPFISRVGAAYTPAVERRTGIALLRLRYAISETIAGTDAGEKFAEEIVMAAFQEIDGQLKWLEKAAERAGELLDAPLGADMPIPDRQRHLQWALKLVLRDNAADQIVGERTAQIQDSNRRLRKLQLGPRAAQPKIQVRHFEPDLMGVYVLVPGSSVKGGFGR